MSELNINTAAALRAHYQEIILPMWRSAGFNPSLGLAFESMAADGRTPTPPVRYRAMACARQLFVFSLAAQWQHADTLFAALLGHFHDAKNGGWFYSVDADGAPKERQKDLYTHAFVIFACAEYARHPSAPQAQAAREVLEQTSALIEQRMRDGELFSTAMAEDFSAPLSGPTQNPLMHLTEAWLAASASTSDALFGQRLTRLVRAFATTFVDPGTGCIAELPLGSENNWFEPGHQFEWLYLAGVSSHPVFAETGMKQALLRAFEFARRSGVDPLTGGVAAAVNGRGEIIDPTQRIWAQSEYLRALAHHPDSAVRDELAVQIGRFSARFLTAQGWIESQSADGQIVRAELPSTTPYHLATAYAELG
jgi:mannose/cellobiose epimerase-like protein (N-acyl-D-glucosamine 2-epimerase family)